MSADPACRAPVPPEGAVPRTCVPFAHVPAVPVVAVPYVPVPVPSGLPVLSVAGILPDRTGNVDVTRFLEEWAAGPLAGKADKAVPRAAGSLASLDASGNLLDSGETPASIARSAVEAVVANAPGTMDTLEEIADILGSSQQTGTVLKRILDLESGKVDSSSLSRVATSGSYNDLSDKPAIPAVDATLATQGAAADAKAVGDALRGGFTPWVCDPATQDDESFSVVFREHIGEYEYWALYLGDRLIEDNYPSAINSTELGFDEVISVTATRRLITPTKTSQLANDSGFLTSHQDISGKADKVANAIEGNLAALDAQGNLADSGAKPSDFAAKDDLPYATVTLGEWEFSGSGYDPELEYHFDNGYNPISEVWEYDIYTDDASVNDQVTSQTALTVVVFAGANITATCASTLQDRACNRVVVTGDTTLTLPAANPGKSRDFYIKLSLSSGASVSFVASSGENAPSFIPASPSVGSGVWHFTEVVDGTYSITECGVDYAAILGDIETVLHTINNGSTT